MLPGVYKNSADYLGIANKVDDKDDELMVAVVVLHYLWLVRVIGITNKEYEH